MDLVIANMLFLSGQVGLLSVPFRSGLRAMFRLLEMIQVTNTAVEPYASKHAWTLEAFVVHHQYRGQGIGSTVLGSLLRGVEGSGPITFMTQTEANVRFYSKLGFTVLNADRLKMGSGTILNWVLQMSV